MYSVGLLARVPEVRGFTVLHRSLVLEAPNLEMVMGVLERNGKSTSSKHYHPGGEFGFVIEGEVTIQAEDQDTVTLGEGSSFHQPAGAWHIVSTSEAGAKSILFRILKKGDPMVVDIE